MLKVVQKIKVIMAVGSSLGGPDWRLDNLITTGQNCLQCGLSPWWWEIILQWFTSQLPQLRYVSDWCNRFNSSNLIFALIDKYLQNYSLVPALVSTVPLPPGLIRLNIPEKFQSFHLSWPAFSLESVLLTCLGLNSWHLTNQKEASPASQWECWELRQAVKLSLTALLAGSGLTPCSSAGETNGATIWEREPTTWLSLTPLTAALQSLCLP